MSRPKYKRVELGEYIVADQAICHGKPTFKGTRIIVDLVILKFCSGWTIDEVASRYELPREAIEESIRLAAQMLRDYGRLPAPPIVPIEELLKMEMPAELQKYKRVELGEYIVADQAICHGKPTFKGTRIIVDLVIKQFCYGHNVDEIAKDYQLPKAAIQEALKLSTQMLREYGRFPAPPIMPIEELLKMEMPMEELPKPLEEAVHEPANS